MKKVIMIFIIFILIITSTSALSVETAVDKNNEALALLIDLKLLDSKTEGGKSITRGEYVKLLIDVFYPDLTFFDEDNDFYYDVTPADPLFHAVSAATRLGIVKGDGNGLFMPSGKITAEQAAKMLVISLGLNEIAEQKGGYHFGYMSVATENKLFKGFSFLNSKSVNFNEAAQLILNALNTQAFNITISEDEKVYNYIKGVTYMEQNMNITVREGIVSAVGGFSIDNFKALDKNEIEVSGMRYRYNKDYIAEELLGEIIKFYVKKSANDEEEIIHISRKNAGAEPKTIQDINLNEITKTHAAYFENEKVVNLNIAEDTKIIYNGLYLDTIFSNQITAGMLNPQNGTVSLKDTNQDGVYDLIIIFNYETAIIESVEKSNKIINFMDQRLIDNENALNLDSDITGYISIQKNGKEVLLKDLARGDTVLVAKSKGMGSDKIILVKACNKTVNGKIGEISEDTIKIGENSYSLNSYFQNNSAKHGVAMTAKLDTNNKVVELLENQSNVRKYGYLRLIGSTGGLDEAVQVEIFETTLEFATYTCANKVILNGKTEEIKSLTSKLQPEQLIVYETDENGMIKSINTAKNNTDSIVGYDKTQFSLDYSGPGERFYNNMIAERYFVNDQTGIFIIPKNRSDTEIYSYGNQTLLTKQEKVYPQMNIYDADESRAAKILLYEEATKVVGAIDENERCIVVSDIIRAVDKDGASRIMIKGFREGKDFAGFLTDENLQEISIDNKYSDEKGMLAANLKVGDVIQAVLDARNEISGFRLVFRNKTQNFYETFNGTGTVLTFSKLYTAFAKVTDLSSSMLAFNPNTDQTSNILIRPIKLNNVGIYKYYKNSNKVKKISANDISVGDCVFVRINWQTAHEIMVVEQ